MAVPEQVTDPGDPRIAEYTALNDPAIRRRVEREGGYFVVEGVLAIGRLLATEDWSIRSLLLLPRAADRLAGALADLDAPVLVAGEDVLREVVGFDLHRGALASVTRRPPVDLDRLLDGAGLLLVVEGVNDHENIGALYRNAAAFGVDAVLLDPTSADPFYRRSVRVSVGNVLAVPTGHLAPLPDAIHDLHARGVTTVALSPTAGTDLRDLAPAGDAGRDSDPVALLVGAEGSGLTAPALAAAHHRVSIAMAHGVDSLNVATAAAIALHHLAPRPRR